MASPVSRSALRAPARLSTGLAVASALALAFTVGGSQTVAQSGPPEFYPGKNVDVVGPFGTAPYSPSGSNPFMLGDPDKKQQNEPSCDINPSNPLVIFCGLNDYRAVDRLDIVGEPWVSASFSLDGGLTWKSHLHPGFRPKSLTAPAPLVAPLGYDTAADPVVRVVPGLGLYNFIAFNRSGDGALLLSRWYERNTEGGFPYTWLNTVEVAKGTGSPGDSGKFLDKPDMEVALLPGTTTYNLTVPDPTPTNPANTRIQKVPAGIVHVAYAVFTGNNQQDGTKIVYTRSTSYGDRWDPVTTLSESQSINQAADIAADPKTGRVVVVWRRFADANGQQKDAIMYALSSNNGQSFTKPALLAEICPFTQNTTSSSFRTTTHPFMTFDGTAFHAVWAERQGTCTTPPTGSSRIVMSDLAFAGNSATWSTPRVIDSSVPARGPGQQFHPMIAAAGNRLLVGWFDTRNDLRLNATNFPDPSPDPYIDDRLYQDKTKVRRRSADIFAAEAFAGQTPVFGAPKQVSRYRFGYFPGSDTPQLLERNKLNARMFQSGTRPFHGDYTTAAAVRWVLKDPIASPGEWVSSAGFSGAQPVFHLAWTDNRLVRGDVSAGLVDATGTVYTPPSISTEGEPDPSLVPRPACVATNTGTRDQSVFSSRIFPPIVLLSASASKSTVNPAGGAVQRSYAIVVQNTTSSEKTINLSIVGAPGVIASFKKDASLTSQTGVKVGRRSMIARTVYVTSSGTELPIVKVTAASASDDTVTTYLNGNPNAPPLDDPLDPNDRITGTTEGQVDSLELHTPDILYRATSIGTPAIDDPAIDDPAIDDPAIDDPAIDDPAIDDPAIDDPAIDDPAIDDPAIDDPAIDDPAIDDPAIDDPAIDDAAVAASAIQDPDTDTGTNNTGQKLTQITWKIGLKGNIATSMSSKVYLNLTNEQLAALKAAIRSGKSQLLVSRRYRTTDARGTGCTPVRVSNYQVIANIVDPELTNNPNPPDLVNPGANEPSFAIPPGGAVYLTFRLWGDVPGFNPNKVGTVVQSQPGPPASEPLDNDIPVDTAPPELTLPVPNGTSYTPGGIEATGPTTTVSFTAQSNDNFDGALTPICTSSVALTNTGGTYTGSFPVGLTPVTCTVTDAGGNTQSGSFFVKVEDRTAPTLTVPTIDATTAEATSPNGTTATFSVSATDLADAAPTVICTTPSGATVTSATVFPVGTTLVSCTATDKYGNSTTASFNVTVNDTTPPTALDLPVSLAEDGSTPIALSATDIVASSLAYTIVAGPLHGTLTGSAPNVVYTPALNYNGPDSFTFKANDGRQDSNVATVTINVTPVNDAPTANAQAVSTDEDVERVITLAGQDIDSTSLTYLVVGGPTNGTLSGSGAALTYTPNSNYTGPDSFTFKVNDGTLDSAIATVTISVTPVNDAPAAGAVTVTTSEDTAVPVALSASDVEASPLTYSILSGPTRGTLSGVAPSLVYTPTSNLVGSDSFTYQVNDGAANSNVATVSINVTPVNDAPTADAQAVLTDEDVAKVITLTGADIDSASLTYIVVNGPTNGTLSGSGAALTYTPNSNYNGSDSFTFKVNDGTLDSGVATVTISVASVNDVPAAGAVTATTSEDTAVPVPLSASDVEASPLTYSILSGPTRGTLSGVAPNLVYTPTSNLFGSDSFTYQVNDGTANSNVATVAINVTPVNDAPTANAQPVSTNEDTARAITLTGSDIEGSSLTYTVVTAPTRGTLSGTAPNLTYTPGSNYFGADSFTFKVNDGGLDSAVATVSISVASVNDPPTFTPPANITTTATSASGVAVTFTANGNDVEQGTIAAVCTPASGSTFPIGTTTVNCTVTDSGGLTASGSFTVKVDPAIYGFKGLLSPWKRGVTNKLGSTFQIVWQYTGAPSSTTAINSATARPQLVAYGPIVGGCPAVGTPISSLPVSTPKVVDDAGSSFFQYNSTTFTWQYNWKPASSSPTGCYMVYVKSQQTGQTNGGWDVTLIK